MARSLSRLTVPRCELRGDVMYETRTELTMFSIVVGTIMLVSGLARVTLRPFTVAGDTCLRKGRPASGLGRRKFSITAHLTHRGRR